MHRLQYQFYGIRCSLFSTLEVILSLSNVRFPIYGQKRSCSGFETSFTAFDVLFLALWRLYWVDWRYCCQDTGKNVYAPALNPVLRISLFYFEHFLGYFESIECTVAKIWAKVFIRLLWNPFYGIRCYICSNFMVISSWSEVLLPRYGTNSSFLSFETGITEFAVLFLALWKLVWVDWRYCCQDMGENIHFPALKPVLGDSLFWF